MADVPEITQDDLDNTPETPAVTSPAFAPDSSFGDGSAQTPSEQPVPDAPESSSTSDFLQPLPDNPATTAVLPDPSAAPQTAPDSVNPTSDPTSTSTAAVSDSDAPIFEGQVADQGVDPSTSPDSSGVTSSEPSTSLEPVSSTPSSDTDSPAPASSDPHEGDDVDTDLPAYDAPADDPDPEVVDPVDPTESTSTSSETSSPAAAPETPDAPTFPAPAEQGQDGVDEETGQVIPNTSIEQGPGLPPEVSASPSPEAPGGLSVATDEDDDTSASVWVPGEDNDDYDDGENHGATLANGAVFEQSVSGYTPHFRGSIVNSTIQVQRADWVGTEVFTVDASDVDELVDFIQKLAGFIED